MIRAIFVFPLLAAVPGAAAPRGLIETVPLAIGLTAQRANGSADSLLSERNVFSGSRSEVYRRLGDFERKVHIFAPPGHRSTDRRAAIVFFFGGGWRSGSASQFVPQCRHLVERGMVAIAADYRVYDRHRAKVADCVSDAQASVRWVRANVEPLGIPYSQMEAFTQAMRKAGNRCELVGLEGQGHGFFNRGESVKATLILAKRFLRGLGYLEPGAQTQPK